MSVEQETKPGEVTPDIKDVLSFKRTGRQVPLDTVADEFKLMKSFLNKPFTAKNVTDICRNSGTHFLKLVSPRDVSTGQACLYFPNHRSNERPKLLPSVNAALNRYCQVLFRPLEIEGHPARSVVDNILNTYETSDFILQAFAEVFGQDVLETIREALLEHTDAEKKDHVTELASHEFPIVFVPRNEGGDLQITPISPVAAFGEMKDAVNALYDRKKANDLSLPPNLYVDQEISNKMQNISGAIGGSRRRITAVMPDVMERNDADFHRYANGGSFPRLRDPDIAYRVILYATKLEQDEIYNNSNTRAALDEMADKLAETALDFIDEAVMETRGIAEEFGIEFSGTPKLPEPADVLYRRWWSEIKLPGKAIKSDDARTMARKALTSRHFKRRSRHLEKARTRVLT